MFFLFCLSLDQAEWISFDLTKYIEELRAGGDKKQIRHKLRSLAYKFERKRLEDLKTVDDTEVRKQACEFASRTADKYDNLVIEISA